MVGVEHPGHELQACRVTSWITGRPNIRAADELGVGTIAGPGGLLASRSDAGLLIADVDLDRLRYLCEEKEQIVFPKPYAAIPGVLQWRRPELFARLLSPWPTAQRGPAGAPVGSSARPSTPRAPRWTSGSTMSPGTAPRRYRNSLATRSKPPGWTGVRTGPASPQLSTAGGREPPPVRRSSAPPIPRLCPVPRMCSRVKRSAASPSPRTTARLIARCWASDSSCAR